MNRILLLVPLLLAAGVVLADDVPESEGVATDTEARAPVEEDAMGAVPAGDAPDAEGVADATEAQGQTKDGAKLVDGMSVLGNREAPKSLVIVPWKSSEIGDSLGISPMLDDSRRPVDREVFMRALNYYEIQNGGLSSTAAIDEEAGRK
jgi:hypothetical protein